MAFTVHPKFPLLPKVKPESLGEINEPAQPSDAGTNAYVLEQLGRIGINPSEKCHTCVKLHQCSIKVVRNILAGKAKG